MSLRSPRPTAPTIIVLSALLCMLLNTVALAQWSTPVRISEPGGGYYPQILAQGDTLHVVYENASIYDKISYVRSTDGGQTWSEYVVLSPRAYFARVVESGEESNIIKLVYLK